MNRTAFSRIAACQKNIFFFPAVLALLILSAQNAGQAQTQVLKPPPADVMQHLAEDNFVEIHKVAEIPQSVKAWFYRQTGVNDISKIFANPDGQWQSGCSRLPGGPPGRQFVAGGKSKSLCLLYYEIGGIALVDSAEIYKLSTDKNAVSERVWTNSMFPSHPKTLEQLLKAVRTRIKG